MLDTMSNDRSCVAQLDALFAGIRVPALPGTAAQFLQLADNPENGPAEFAQLLEADQRLARLVLRFVNSPYFSLAREITSVRQAVTLVGIRTINHFVLTHAVRKVVPAIECARFDHKQFWQDALRRALFAQALGKQLEVENAELLFAGALLQDVAVPFLTAFVGDRYTVLFEHRQDGVVRLSDLEQEVFGWNHAMAGSRIARRWSLPIELLRLVEGHTSTADGPDDDPNRMVVALSAWLPAVIDQAWVDFAQFDPVCQATWGVNYWPLLEQVDLQFAALAPLLVLDTPDRSLLERYQEAAAVVW